jgi:hypothetical protein
MSKISLVILLLLQAGTSFAQNYFAFISADSRQPFYVRVDSEFHSSSAEGHLILSQLKDSTYTITIGFPGQTLPEQRYSFAMHSRDQAFELRPQGQDGLRLYDLQGNEWLSPQGGGGVGDDVRNAGIKKDDAFSRMMAGVVHDTAVLYNTFGMERALSDSPALVATQSAATPLVSADTPTARPDTAAHIAAIAANTPATSLATTTDSTRLSPAARPDTGVALAGKPADSTMMVATAATAIPATAATPPSPATTTAAATAIPATTGTRSTTTATTPMTTIADTTVSQAAGVMTHEAAPRFTDSGTAPLYRPIPKDTTKAAPIPSSVGIALYRPASGVVKLSERHGTKNVKLVYADHSGGKKADTIVVIIPIDSPIAKTTGRPPHVSDSTHGPASRAHGPNADSPMVGVGTAYRGTIPPTPPAEAPRTHPADTTRRPARAAAFVNSDCHDFASDFDVDKLRVKMLESAKDDDRITVARKTFKIKCFSTRQIRTLSEVFTSDAAKFRFFEAAWPFAADEHFHELSDLLADPVYNSKFKTMTHQQ